MRLAHRFGLLLRASLLPMGVSAAAHGGVPSNEVTLPCTYVIAPGGHDGNSGTSATAPFATLERAQAAVRESRSKVVCLRAGIYHRRSALRLSRADNGETWRYYAADGVNTAVLDGGNAANLFNIEGAVNVEINGLKMQHVYDYAINSGGALSDNIVVKNCDIGFNQHTSHAGGFNPMIGLGNVTNARILHNYVHDTASQGIALYAFNSGDTVDGGIVGGNVVLRAVRQMSDGGAIYVNMRRTNVNGGRVVISNNFVRDWGAPGISAATGIYLDDDSSHVTVIGNVIGPANPRAGPRIHAVLFNGGSANVVKNNIIDLGDGRIAVNASGPGGTGGTIVYGDPAGPNLISGNIVIANHSGAPAVESWDVRGHVYDQNPAITSSWLTISNNLYYNYGGGVPDSQGNIVSDAHPIFANPQVSGWTYTVAAGSRAFRGPVNFKPILGGWGPPGFIIPQDGNPPSSPH